MWLHVDLTKLRNATTQLEECLDAFKDSHMREANHFDEFQFGVLRQCRNGLRNPEHRADYVVGRVPEIPRKLM